MRRPWHRSSRRPASLTNVQRVVHVLCIKDEVNRKFLDKVLEYRVIMRLRLLITCFCFDQSPTNLLGKE